MMNHKTIAIELEFEEIAMELEKEAIGENISSDDKEISNID